MFNLQSLISFPFFSSSSEKGTTASLVRQWLAEEKVFSSRSTSNARSLYNTLMTSCDDPSNAKSVKNKIFNFLENVDLCQRGKIEEYLKHFQSLSSPHCLVLLKEAWNIVCSKTCSDGRKIEGTLVDEMTKILNRDPLALEVFKTCTNIDFKSDDVQGLEQVLVKEVKLKTFQGRQTPKKCAAGSARISLLAILVLGVVYYARQALSPTSLISEIPLIPASPVPKFDCFGIAQESGKKKIVIIEQAGSELVPFHRGLSHEYHVCMKKYAEKKNRTVCSLLKQASLQAGGPLDAVLMQGHGNKYGLFLDAHTRFNKLSVDQTKACFQKYLKKGAPIFLKGCNTGNQHQDNRTDLSIAQIIAKETGHPVFAPLQELRDVECMLYRSRLSCIKWRHFSDDLPNMEFREYIKRFDPTGQDVEEEGFYVFKPSWHYHAGNFFDLE